MTKTLRESFYFFRTNIIPLLGFTFSIGVLMILLVKILTPLFINDSSGQEISPESVGPFAQLLDFIIRPIYIGGLIAMIYGLAINQNKGIISCLTTGILKWPMMLIATILTTLIIFAGFLLFIIPGIWLFSRLFLVPYLVMLKNQSPLDALSNSFEMTKNYSLTILNDVVLLIIAFALLVIFINFLQLLHPLLLLIILLLFQTMAHVIYYRHYEILSSPDSPNKV